MSDDRRVPPGGGIVIALTATLAAALAAVALVLWVRHKPKPDFVQTPNYSTFPSSAFDVPADSTPAATPWWELSPDSVGGGK